MERAQVLDIDPKQPTVRLILENLLNFKDL